MSVVLLVIYLFINIPVSVWHSHESIDTEQYGQSLSQTDTSDIAFLPSGKSGKENCSICGHHYSVFYEATSTNIIPRPVTEQLSYVAFYTSRKSQTFSYTFSNKGPPTLS